MWTKIYSYPESSFLSVEKDLAIISNMIIQNDNLKKLLYYTTDDCLKKPNLNDEQTAELFKNNLKIVPKLYIDGEVLNYVLISFDNFSPNNTNPEFRNNTVEFDIICHTSQWNLGDFKLRPYRIAAEIDTMFNNKYLTGIGRLQFISGSQIVLTEEFQGFCLLYAAIHGDEDKKPAANPNDQSNLEQNFDKMFNNI